MSGILKRLPKFDSPNVIVDMDSMDDAGVYKISDDIALVQSVDFFSPIVNAPYDFGKIVAANSLSDIYAMGGMPLTAMNILAYPAGLIPPDSIEELLTGSCEKLEEAGVSLIGGHTMEQEDFLYGMSITGTVDPRQIKTNSCASEGDIIILTKPIGAGVYSDAVANDGLTKEQYAHFVNSMSRLNKYAAKAIMGLNVSAMTDITGFGLLGHSLAIAKNANVLLEFDSESVPFYDDIFDLMESYDLQGVCKNREYVEDFLSVDSNVDIRRVKLMTEAETSGGLLIIIDKNQVKEALDKLYSYGDVASKIVGRVTKRVNNKTFLKVT